MTSFFNFNQDIVYAPGMTCVYDQLFDGIFSNRWKAYPFRQPELGFKLYDAPAIVIENLFDGEVQKTSTLFANPSQFLEENLRKVDFDVLAIESRWLFYESFLFKNIDWNDLQQRLRKYHDVRIIFIDCYYPHYGYLQNINLLRRISREELNYHFSWQTSRHKLLEILICFEQFRYVSVDMMTAYEGYRFACMDQPDHYTANFRETFKRQLLSHSDERVFSNIGAFNTVQGILSVDQSEIELIEGMNNTFQEGDTILKLRVKVKLDDPLMCDTEMILIWISLVDGVINWRKNYTLNPKGKITPIINDSDENNNKILIKSFDDLIKISTFGLYKFSLIR
jgi:hypothetical protein